MRMRTVISGLLLLLLCICVSAFAAAEDENQLLGKDVYGQYARFISGQDICTTAANRLYIRLDGLPMVMWLPMMPPEDILELVNGYIAEGLGVDGISGSLLKYRPDGSGMMTDAVLIENADVFHQDWNAFDAGERAVAGINSLYQISGFLDGEERPPVDTQMYIELTSRNGCQIMGLDSAYACGETEIDQGVRAKWEIYPFAILTDDGYVYENRCYVYCCVILPGSDGTMERSEYYISDEDAVCRLFSRLIELNDHVSEQDRKRMEMYVQKCGLLDDMVHDEKNVDAYFRTGIKYFQGIDCSIDYALAKEMFELCARAGHADAMCFLGLMYDEGMGVQKDRNAAVEWYRKSVDGGNTDAMVYLAWLYMDRDECEKALELLLGAAELGNTNAMMLLGAVYSHGMGVEQDQNEAKKWYWAAWMAGNSDGFDQYVILNKGNPNPPE